MLASKSNLIIFTLRYILCYQKNTQLCFVKNFGLAVILAGALIRLILYPLTKKSAMQSENLKKAQPELQRLEKKYANKTALPTKLRPHIGC